VTDNDTQLVRLSKRYNASGNRLIMLLTAMLVFVSVWSYWPTITLLYKDWQGNDDYSAGQLVPLIAIFLVWHERKKLKDCLLEPSWLWGMTILLIAQIGRFFGLLFMFESAERYSMVLTIFGLVLIITGSQVAKKSFWIFLFLFLMVPFPGKLHNLISGPLQSAATTGSVFLLEALGAAISQQGNVIILNRQTTMAVEEACSGLRMLTSFIIVAAFIAYMIKRSRTQKALLLFSSVPIAVLCNILRLCVTAGLFMLISSQAAEKFFHDFAGLAMMPAAVVIIFGELWIMNLLTENETSS
jgi:exosortase